MTRTAKETTYLLKGTKLGETAKAVRFSFNEINGAQQEDSRVEWFPFSQVTQMTYDPKGVSGEDTIRVKEWILMEKGII